MKKCLFLTVLLLLLILPVQAAQTPADGQYTIAAALSGGSGRAKVESPAKLTVQDGRATAVVVWSSPYYEYMLVDGVYYAPVNTEGNSTFEIPVQFDTDMAFSAQTVAMSEPHEIDYTLRFDSATIKPLTGGTFAPAPLEIAAAALAVLIAAGLVVLLKRRAKGRKAAAEKQDLEK